MLRLPGLVYTSPYSFTRRERLQLLFLPPLIAFVLKALCRTCRWEVRNAPGPTARLYAFWHEAMGLAAWQYRNSGGHTLTSYSFDGELAARVVQRLGMEALRGSSSRGGAQALDDMAEALRHVIVGFTLDGPRGPRRQAKPGIALLAARATMPVIPMALVAQHCWRLNSWDRFPIPKPFSRVVCAYGSPIPPPATTTPEAGEAMRHRVEEELNALHAAIEAELEVNIG
ncbi:MAG TPA: DUF374 domain-containing protein [Candidatus Hydrogenedentes bacterium]|nr:DUF374 domain-containing protein [Candidatus Hydrogenedentota bacterium]